MTNYLCDPPCENGFCRGSNQCSCYDGWGGSRCNKPAEHCTDALICENGSTCAKSISSTFHEDYYCDCSIASSYRATTVFAGRSCQYQASMYCVYGTSRSMTAFCVNDGICKEIMISEDKPFPGCDCPDMFTGYHCEIPIGQTTYAHTGVSYSRASSSAGNEAYYSSQPNSTSARFVVVYITLVAFAVFIVLTAIVRNFIEIKRNREIRIETAADRDLHIEADGEDLREHVQKGDDCDQSIESNFA